MSLSDIIADLQRGRRTPAARTGDPPSKPPWLVEDTFNRGKQFFRDHYFCCFLSMFTSLVCGLSVNNLLEALVFTNKSDTPRKALTRYVHTFKHVTLWHDGNVWDTTTDAHKSITTVRDKHVDTATDMNNGERDGVVDTDAHESITTVRDKHVGTATKMNNGEIDGVVHFSQYDMALVQCGFMGYIVMYPEAFGIAVSQDQIDDYVHFWRGIGYLLGIDDEFNLCTDGCISARAKCKAIEEHVLVPALKNPPENFHNMAEAFIAGANIPFMFTLFSRESVIAFGLDTMRRPREALGKKDTIRFYYLKWLAFLLRNFSCFRILLNISIRVGMWWWCQRIRNLSCFRILLNRSIQVGIWWCQRL